MLNTLNLVPFGTERNGTELSYPSTGTSERYVISERFCRRSDDLRYSREIRSPTEAFGDDAVREAF